MADDLLPFLAPKDPEPNRSDQGFAQVRAVPFQPEGLPLGVVYMGSDLGTLPWSGARPNPGDTVAILGTPPNQVVVAQRKPRLVDPIFTGACRCKCPASSTGGMIAYVCSVQGTSILLVVDGASEDVLFYSTLPEVISGEGVAIDPEPPHDLYLLDDRAGTAILTPDGTVNPDPLRQWLFILKYTLSGSGYAFADVEILPGAFARGPGTNGFNCLSVIDGECWITIGEVPAQILKWSGAGFTEINLTRDGAPHQAVLLGPVVRVTDRPASRSQFYALALIEQTEVWQVLRFNGDGEIGAVLESAEFTTPSTLLSVCNRLTVFQSIGTFRGEVPEEEGGGGGGGEPVEPGEEN